jgi:hypothetical protein
METIMTFNLPVNEIEEQLMTMEDLEIAAKVKCYLNSLGNKVDYQCDLCESKIVGRHLIDGKLRYSDMWAIMCPTCFSTKGSWFGIGVGQLYSKTDKDKWLLTCGFTADQLSDNEDD